MRTKRQPLRTCSTFSLASIALVVAVCSFRAWTVSQWSWYGDDWSWLGDRATMSAGEFIFRGYNSHLMPGQFAIMWVLGGISPANHGLAAAVTTALAGTALTSWVLALRELFGERLHLLAGVAFIGFTPLMTGVSLWWATALQSYVIQTVMGLCVWRLARWLYRGHRRSDVVWLALTYAAGLFMWEKCLLVAIPLPFVIMMFGRGRIGNRARLALRSLWPVSVLAAGYVALYVVLTTTGRMGASMSTTGLRSVAEVSGFYWHAVVDMLLPILVGGPFHETSGPPDFYPASATGQAAVMVAAIVAASALAVWFRRRAGWAIALTMTYVVVTLGLILFNERFEFFGNDAARVPYYWPDIVVVLVLAAAFLTTSELGAGAHHSWRRRPTCNTTASAVTSHCAVALVALCVVGTGRAFGTMSEASPAPYWNTLRHDAERVGAATMANGPAPPDLVGFLFPEGDGTVSSLLAGLDLPIRFDTPTERYLVVNGQGHLVLGRMRDDALHSLDNGDSCGYAVRGGETAQVELDRDAFDFDWIVELTYFAASNAEVEVRTDLSQVPLDLPASTAELPIRTKQFHVKGPVTRLTITGLTASTAVCVTEARIGVLEPSNVPPVLDRSTR